MKPKILILFTLCIVIMSFTLNQKGKFRPPGTVKIVDNFFFDETELTNLDWKEYLYYQKRFEKDRPELFQNALLDTTVWESQIGFDSLYREKYHRHPSYNGYPVVGVTHQQAKDYCKWRTEAVKIMLKTNNIKGPKDFEYRLPTKTEWELIAAAGYDDKSKRIFRKYKQQAKKKEEEFINKNGQGTIQYVFKANMKSHEKDAQNRKYFPGMLSTTIVTAPARTYLPNKYGVYNIYGNVAEMIAEEGIAMGGSYLDYYEDIVPTNKPLKYDKPERWLGFRCVCEIIEE